MDMYILFFLSSPAVRPYLLVLPASYSSSTPRRRRLHHRLTVVLDPPCPLRLKVALVNGRWPPLRRPLHRPTRSTVSAPATDANHMSRAAYILPDLIPPFPIWFLHVLILQIHILICSQFVFMVPDLLESFSVPNLKLKFLIFFSTKLFFCTDRTKISGNLASMS
jgi:hypothetical protein